MLRTGPDKTRHQPKPLVPQGLVRPSPPKLIPFLKRPLARQPGVSLHPGNANAASGLRSFGRRARTLSTTGHARPKVSHVERGQPIGRFVSTQRTAHARGKLDPERARMLESLAGWTWDPAETLWDDAYGALREFAAREGHAKVPSTHRERELKLGSWVGAQRVAYRRGTLRRDRLATLEGVHGWIWDVKPRHATAQAQQSAT
jgi:hypothetical protein